VRKLLSTLLLLAGFCLGAAISYFNWARVTFDYLAGQVEVPLIALLLAAFVFGLAVMGLLNLGRVWVLKRDVRKLQSRLSLAETELKNLRNIEWAAPSAQPGPLTAPAAPQAPVATPLKNA
jgi:uncharacterized integral membrane protein